MNVNPVKSSESNSDGSDSPFKPGEYLKRKANVTVSPSENATLLFPTVRQSGKDTVEQRHNIRNVNPVTDSIINLGESIKENESSFAGYERSANVSVSAADIGATLIPGDSLHPSDRDLLEDSKSSDGSIPPLPSPRTITRGSHVYWGSEDGLVHMGMRPMHKPRKQLRHREETKEPLIPSNEETPTPITTSTQDMEELSSIAPGMWVTDAPGTEDWITETPEERLANSEDQNIDIYEDQSTITQLQSSTNAPEEIPTNTVEVDLFTVIPEEHLTVAPEDWSTTTPQSEDDWLTFLPQEEDQLVKDVDSGSILNPTPLSFIPVYSSSLHSTLTPTLPPSLPPTPSPQDAIEDTFRITTRGLDFLLEASPTGQSLDTTEFPKDELSTLDLTITTTREGLKVDARDVTLDPSQIAKATSYEGSSYPTATRSATVTTTWVEDHPATFDRQGVMVNVRNGEAVNPSSVGELGDSVIESQILDLESDVRETSTLPVDDLMQQVDGLHRESQTSDNTISRSDNPTQTHPTTTEESDLEDTTSTTLPDNTEDQNSTEVSGLPFGYETHHETNSSGRSIGGFPVLMMDTGDARNESSGVVKGSDSRLEETVLYEIPVVTRNPGPQLSPSVVVALSVCCAVVLVLAALSVALWVFRRHRNRSKIYLSREAAKPRAFFTRPMNPAVLPEDSDRDDAVYMFEFQRPRPPILLGDDQKGIYFIKREEDAKECGESLGTENEAFTDIPLGEAGDEIRTRLEPPKYDLKTKRDSDADSGIRVWSSTGSLHAAASPLPTHCRVPPPPYSPSISKESVCLTVHSLPSLPRNSQLFDV